MTTEHGTGGTISTIKVKVNNILLSTFTFIVDIVPPVPWSVVLVDLAILPPKP